MSRTFQRRDDAHNQYNGQSQATAPRGRVVEPATVGEMVGLPLAAIRKLIRAGVIPTIDGPGGAPLCDLDDPKLKAWMESMDQPALPMIGAPA